MTDDMPGGDAETRYVLAMERIAVALEKLVAERTRPKNTRRIRVELVGVFDGTPRVARFRVSGGAYAAANALDPIANQPGLFRESDHRIVCDNDADLRYVIEVPLIAVYDHRKPLDGMPESKPGTRQQYLVTVDLQPDPATWGWRNWVRL